LNLKITIRNKQTLCVLRVYGDVVALETIFYPDEIRPVSEIPALPREVKADAREMNIAKQLIDNLTAKFDASKYTDEYREALRGIIEAKIAGREVVTQPEAPESNVIDLMEALKASIEKTQKNEEPARKRA
jgi:DNA end-binding protein Ku